MDFVDLSTCSKVDVGDDQKMWRLGCCLGRCRDCPEPFFPRELRDKSDNAPEISFSVYEPHGWCSVHKFVPGGPGECPDCQDIRFMDCDDDETVPPQDSATPRDC